MLEVFADPTPLAWLDNFMTSDPMREERREAAFNTAVQRLLCRGAACDPFTADHIQEFFEERVEGQDYRALCFALSQGEHAQAGRALSEELVQYWTRRAEMLVLEGGGDDE